MLCGKPAILFLSISCLVSACTHPISREKAKLGYVIPTDCPNMPPKEDEVVVFIHYFDATHGLDATDGEDGPSFARVCVGKHHKGGDHTHRTVQLHEPSSQGIVHMHFHLDESVTSPPASLAWRTDDPAWMLADAGAGQVPPPQAWCAETPKPHPNGADLSFHLCPSKNETTRVAIELLLMEP